MADPKPPPPTSRSERFGTVGFSGFPVYGRRSYPGSDEWHRELQGTQADRKYREILDNHGLTGSALRLMVLLVQQVQWSIAPALPDDPAAVAAADMVRAELARMRPGWPQVLAEMMTATMLGWSWHEVVYARRAGGAVGWEGIEYRRQDSRLGWIWSADGRTLEAMEQLTRSGQHAIIPTARSIHFAPDPTTGDPEGRPWLRGVYLDYRDQMQVRTSTLIALQKDATGMIVASVPLDLFASAAAGETSSLTTINAVKADIAALQRGEREGLVIPGKIDADGKETGWGVELLKGGGERQIDHVELIQMFENRIAATLYQQFRLLGSGKSGSFALSADQTEILGVALSGLCDLIAATFSAQAIRPLCALNGIPEDIAPALTHGPIDSPDLTSLAALLREGIAAGALTPDPALEDHVRDLADLPKRPAPATPTATPTDPAPTAAPTGTGGQPVAAQALNGIQITALRETLASITDGTTPEALAREILTASFPAIPAEQIDRMIAAARGGSNAA